MGLRIRRRDAEGAQTMNILYTILAILMVISFIGIMVDQYQRRKESDEITKWLVNRWKK